MSGGQDALSQMLLKILYTVDNEATSFLTRSREPAPVRVEMVPMSSPPAKVGVRIGIVEVAHVLGEVCKSSPELFQPAAGPAESDYNVYFKDVVEADEPFVSLGLLSKLRGGDADETLVIGRICTNFTSLLPGGGRGCETLEVKMRFSKVLTRSNSHRGSLVKAVPARRMNSAAAARRLPAPVGGPAKRRRDANPLPATKAFRTQSLPIWDNPKNSGIRGGTIAHKIYMADRNKEQQSIQLSQQQQGTLQDRKPTYQVMSLQSDTTVTKFKVDDSISKRFEFMNKPKAKRATAPRQAATSSPAMASGAGKRVHKPKVQQGRGGAAQADSAKQSNTPRDFGALGEDQSLQEFLSQSEIKSDLFELEEQNDESASSNKENVPPSSSSVFQQQLLPTDMDDFFNLDLDHMKNTDDEWFQGLFGTPRDATTCNTMPIEDDNDISQADTASTMVHEAQHSTTVLHNDHLSDLDRTSPIDTLSMPLLDLEPRSNQPAKFVSCADQLKRLPLLIKGKEGATTNTPEDEHLEDDVTSLVIQMSTSPSPEDGDQDALPPKQPQEKHLLCDELPSDCDDDDDDDDERLECMKKRKTMPSSPTSMFQPYRDLDGLGAENRADDTSFIATDDFAMAKLPPHADSTPATHISSADDLKKKKDLTNSDNHYWS
ncbi:AFL132Cp [Eremothecium gossypii ATCC 10895]|uniref:AFL132Cp n=1 Tax=Eremothecium gossypii (strain ATCC 10895 / CBS 109.51 / FGSC 9923 / NRRL Y-1056) TaxID=284811 RepID=Q755F5_EREGS|nr:AFL132Cp [Eremothecium gossypii ATCC 10895]AAS53242.2 AFL132Cp [Eremothecium gossypii ATCC 10895]AEY97552.1 FAFL132Cp [Eremothecium gossypii FDAG1]